MVKCKISLAKLTVNSQILITRSRLLYGWFNQYVCRNVRLQLFTHNFSVYTHQLRLPSILLLLRGFRVLLSRFKLPNIVAGTLQGQFLWHISNVCFVTSKEPPRFHSCFILNEVCFWNDITHFLCSKSVTCYKINRQKFINVATYLSSRFQGNKDFRRNGFKISTLT